MKKQQKKLVKQAVKPIQNRKQVNILAAAFEYDSDSDSDSSSIASESSDDQSIGYCYSIKQNLKC